MGRGSFRSLSTAFSASGPAGQLYSAGFSSDGNRVIAGGGNSEIWVWNLDDGGTTEVVLRSFPGRVYDVRFVSGNRILAAGEGGVIESWTLGPDQLIGAQCAREGAQITPDEWEINVPGMAYRAPCD